MDMMNLENSRQSSDSPRKKPRKLALNSVENVKRSLSRLIRDVDNEQSPDWNKYRVMATLLNTLISAYRLDIERRIEKIEDYIVDDKSQKS